jgi:hypothetical protein
MTAQQLIGVFAAVSFLASGCAAPLTGDPQHNLTKVLHRCDRLRQDRDLYTVLASGTGVLAGAGGVATIQFTDTSSRRHVAELSLLIGAAAAILTGAGTASSNAYSDEGCPAWFAKYRTPAQDPGTTINDALTAVPKATIDLSVKPPTDPQKPAAPLPDPN